MSKLSNLIAKDIMNELDDRNLGIDSLDEDMRKEVKNAISKIIEKRINERITK